MKERKEIGEFIRLNAVKLLGKKCNNGKKRRRLFTEYRKRIENKDYMKEILIEMLLGYYCFR